MQNLVLKYIDLDCWRNWMIIYSLRFLHTLLYFLKIFHIFIGNIKSLILSLLLLDNLLLPCIAKQDTIKIISLCNHRISELENYLVYPDLVKKERNTWNLGKWWGNSLRNLSGLMALLMSSSLTTCVCFLRLHNKLSQT